MVASRRCREAELGGASLGGSGKRRVLCFGRRLTASTERANSRSMAADGFTRRPVPSPAAQRCALPTGAPPTPCSNGSARQGCSSPRPSAFGPSGPIVLRATGIVERFSGRPRWSSRRVPFKRARANPTDRRGAGAWVAGYEGGRSRSGYVGPGVRSGAIVAAGVAGEKLVVPTRAREGRGRSGFGHLWAKLATDEEAGASLLDWSRPTTKQRCLPNALPAPRLAAAHADRDRKVLRRPVFLSTRRRAGSRCQTNGRIAGMVGVLPGRAVGKKLG